MLKVFLQVVPQQTEGIPNSEWMNKGTREKNADQIKFTTVRKVNTFSWSPLLFSGHMY